jgi:hypothetical protein
MPVREGECVRRQPVSDERVFTTAHTRTAQSATMNQSQGRSTSEPDPPMLLSVIVVVAICVLTSAVRVARGVIPTDLGSMSEKWIADYRESRES